MSRGGPNGKRRIALASAVAAFVAAVSVGAGVATERGSDVFVLSGRAVDLDGLPVVGASVVADSAVVHTDRAGFFRVESSRPRAWLRTAHPAFLPRTRAADTATSTLVRLTPDDGATVSLTFGGDVMFGRRFLDPDEDGKVDDGQLRPGASASAHLEVLADVRGRLEDSDVTIVNLESPLVRDPVVLDDTGQEDRLGRFHPTKDLVFASSTQAAAALARAGVDIVGLGNNHMFDALDDGVAQTVDALEAAGFAAGEGHTGAGMSAEQAWVPAVTTRKGQSIAVLACTAVTGERGALSYVADDRHGGAAACDEYAIREHVARASVSNDLVVMMIHGGEEYIPEPTPEIRRLSEAARDAGAALVIDHHPHVVGGFDFDGSGLIAWTLGNLVFDQTVWPTFRSYVLTVNVRNGSIVSAYADPLLLNGYTPSGATGGLARAVAADAVARSVGPFTVDDATVFLDVAGRTQVELLSAPIVGSAERGSIYVSDGNSRLVHPVAVPGREVGRDLLGVGGFEDEETRAGRRLAALWAPSGQSELVTTDAAATGSLGARLARVAGNRADVVLTPLHRLPVDPGAELTLTGLARVPDAARATVALHWYRDTTGASEQKTETALSATDGEEWGRFLLDADVPPWAVAVGVYVRLSPPRLGSVHVDVDDLALIEWHDRCLGSCDYLRLRGHADISVVRDRLPGTSDRAPLDGPRLLGDK